MTKFHTFLLIDDDADDILMFEEVLLEADPSVQFMSASDAKEALEKLQEEAIIIPDLIILDLNLPRMDGNQFLTELKRDEKLKHIPVIVYTTSSQSKHTAEAIQKGALGFISKPNSVRELKNIILSIVQSMPNDLEKNLRQWTKV